MDERNEDFSFHPRSNEPVLIRLILVYSFFFLSEAEDQQYSSCSLFSWRNGLMNAESHPTFILASVSVRRRSDM